ncbi:MAG: class I SAM-dependent methyltransferase [Bacteroidales bacterium]
MLKIIYKRLFSEQNRINFIYTFYKIRALFYYGNRYYCNCCNKKFRKFLPKGYVIRQNAKCPYCGSLERTRLLLMYLQNETEIFHKHLKVLHIAPEKCLYNILSKLNIEYIDGDINPAYATYKIDITDIKYPDNYFDIIICSHVLGHILDENTAIYELSRVLNPNGMALILTLLNSNDEKTYENPSVISSSERLLNYGEPDLCRLHGNDFNDTLSKNGFDVTIIDYRKELETQILKRYSLGDGNRELIFKCCKKV